VDQGRGLERPGPCLSGHLLRGDLAKLVINRLHQPLARNLIATPDGAQQERDFVARLVGHDRLAQTG
jgi:hypothetical protein